MNVLITLLLVSSTTAFALAQSTEQPPRPNVVLILADDLGLGDISFHVRTIQKKEPIVETPTLDALAQQSLWFTDGHSATALCSPTRYCIMSGNNNYRSHAPWGVWGTFRESAFRRGEATIGTVLRDAGYQTGFIGKWHLGGDFRDTKTGDIFREQSRGNPDATVDVTQFIDRGPRFCGFDYDFTLPCGIQGPIYICYENEKWYPLNADSDILYLTRELAINAKDISDKGSGLGDTHWHTEKIGDLISQKAVDFIHRSAQHEKPFFLYYCSPMVHIPHCPPETFDGNAVKHQTPSLHTDMIIELDLQIKRIADALKVTGQFNNTLLIVTSDNGGLRNHRDAIAAGHHSSGGWNGSKNSPLEGGHRVPFFALWPNQIKTGITHEPVINSDMIATFAALTKTQLPKGQALDSNNLLPLLLGNTSSYHAREQLLLQAGSKHELIYRKDPWKLIIQSNHAVTKFEPIALFNLQTNPDEDPADNLIEHPEHATRATNLFEEYMHIRTNGIVTLPHGR